MTERTTAEPTTAPARAGLSYDQYCDQIETQSGLAAAALAALADADLTAAVPSCPGWNVGQLVRHLGGAQRWATEIVTSRAGEPVPDNHFRDLGAYAREDPAVVGPWLMEGGRELAGALRAAGSAAPLWTPVPGGTTVFYARRFTYETALHRADAVLALGQDFALDPAVAIDGVDEWLTLGALPMHFEFHPRVRELFGPGRTLHLHATDTGPDAAAEWVIDLTGEVITWHRAHRKAAVAVRGPVTELLLMLYRRRPPGARTEVLGDGELLSFFLDRMSFE
jgi:uncharacterized protein (TIGR03083 family)